MPGSAGPFSVHPMLHGASVRQRRWLRGRALLLLGVFLGAGSSFPSLDALLYHTRPARFQEWRIHLEAAGDCPSHTEHCTLGRTAPGSRAVAAPSDELPVIVYIPRAPKTFITQHHTGTCRLTVAQPRAPPASLA